MRQLSAFIKENKSDLLWIAFVFSGLALVCTDFNRIYPFMPSGEKIFFPFFILLYIGYFVAFFRLKTQSADNNHKNFRQKSAERIIRFLQENRKNLISVVMVLLAICCVDMVNRYFHLSLPSNNLNGEREKATVITVDNSLVMSSGPVSMGEQYCTVMIETGKYQGQKVRAVNMLRAQMELDTLFQAGDLIQIAVSKTGENPDGSPELYVVAQDYYRIHYEVFLFLIFA